MVNVTVEDVVKFVSLATNILNQSTDKKSVFLFSLKKMIERTKPIHDKYLDQIEEKKIDLAGKDKDGYVIFDEKGNYKLLPESTKELKKFIRELNKEIVEIEPYISKQDVGVDLLLREILTPFVFEEINEASFDSIENNFTK